MRKYLTLFVFIFGLSTLQDCMPDKNILTVKGVIQQQGITSYQYGTHRIVSDTTFYALQSEVVPLDSFNNMKVKIKGKKVDGYPLEGGPILLEVIDVNKE